MEQPMENIVWFDLLIDMPDIGEVKMTFTSKGSNMTQTWQDVEKLTQYLNENYQGKVKPASVAKGTTQKVGDKVTSVPADGSPTSGEMDIVKVTVETRADDKSKVMFFQSNHQYPDISAVMQPINLLKLFAPLNQDEPIWAITDFEKAGTFDPVNFKLYWRNGTKTNTAGNFYKNVVKLEQ